MAEKNEHLNDFRGIGNNEVRVATIYMIDLPL